MPVSWNDEQTDRVEVEVFQMGALEGVGVITKGMERERKSANQDFDTFQNIHRTRPSSPPFKQTHTPGSKLHLRDQGSIESGKTRFVSPR